MEDGVEGWCKDPLTHNPRVLSKWSLRSVLSRFFLYMFPYGKTLNGQFEVTRPRMRLRKFGGSAPFPPKSLQDHNSRVISDPLLFLDRADAYKLYKYIVLMCIRSCRFYLGITAVPYLLPSRPGIETNQLDTKRPSEWFSSAPMGVLGGE